MNSDECLGAPKRSSVLDAAVVISERYITEVDKVYLRGKLVL